MWAPAPSTHREIRWALQRAMIPSNLSASMNSYTVTLPDGSQQSVPQGTRPIDIARSISPRLASDAIVARVNGELYDLTRPLEGDAGVKTWPPRNRRRLKVLGHPPHICLPPAYLNLTRRRKLEIGPPQ